MQPTRADTIPQPASITTLGRKKQARRGEQAPAHLRINRRHVVGQALGHKGVVLLGRSDVGAQQLWRERRGALLLRRAAVSVHRQYVPRQRGVLRESRGAQVVCMWVCLHALRLPWNESQPPGLHPLARVALITVANSAVQAGGRRAAGVGWGT